MFCLQQKAALLWFPSNLMRLVSHLFQEHFVICQEQNQITQGLQLQEKRGTLPMSVKHTATRKQTCLVTLRQVHPTFTANLITLSTVRNWRMQWGREIKNSNWFCSLNPSPNSINMKSYETVNASAQITLGIMHSSPRKRYHCLHGFNFFHSFLSF